MAIASASAERRLDDDIVVFGEVGLGGEIRSVSGLDRRVAEASKLGFKKAIGPKVTKGSRANNFVEGVSDMRQALITYLQK